MITHECAASYASPLLNMPAPCPSSSLVCPLLLPLLLLRSQCAHIMAMAVQRLFKDAQVTIGPWIDRGFYYDFDIPTPLSDKDLKAIRKEMARIMRLDLPFVREEVRWWWWWWWAPGGGGGSGGGHLAVQGLRTCNCR